MFSFFINSAFSLNPIILIPGLYGSPLWGTTDGTYNKGHWYCSKKLDDDTIWLNPLKAVPPLYNCVFRLLTPAWNPETQTVGSQPGLDVHNHNFGGREGIDYIFHWPLSIKSYNSFAYFFKYLEKEGYEVGKTVFGAPYDWRLSMGAAGDLTTPNGFFGKLKDLVEHSYQINDGIPVTLLGYSLGGYMAQHFLANLVEKEWKEKYIRKVIFLAPAFGGAGKSVDVLWTQLFPIAKFIKSKDVRGALTHMPCLHSLLPNYKVFVNNTVILTPEGKQITASDLPQFFIDQGKLVDETISILETSLPFISQELKDPDVPTYILYNSGLNTTSGLDLSKGYDEDPVLLITNGDETVPAIGPEWACNNWNKNKNHALVCYNFDMSKSNFDHEGLTTNDFAIERIYNATNDYWIKNKNTIFITGPMVEVDEQNPLALSKVRPDIRKETLKIRD